MLAEIDAEPGGDQPQRLAIRHNIASTPSQLITRIDHILAWFAKYPSE
jgi:hypothetical protein